MGVRLAHLPRFAAASAIGAVACLLGALCATAQSTEEMHPWQKVQMLTAAQVQAGWRNPPSQYGPEPYFGMNGAVTLQSLAHDLDIMKSLGFHAVTAQAGGGMPVTYLTPAYFAFFKQFVEEAKKRDMRVWIVDDIGYPSGFAGGLFAKAKHNLSMQALTLDRPIPVHGGATINQAVGPDAVAADAVNSSGRQVAVPIANGSIDWTAPAGSDWNVEIVEHVFRTSPTRSDTNPKHTKDFSQPLEDYMNPAATAAYLEATHDGYYKAMPGLFGSTILGFRGDEPDYSISGLPWTETFFATFQRIKGYDIRPYLAIILASERTGRVQRGQPGRLAPVELSGLPLRAKADYYDVFSRMFREGFFKPQGLWCAGHGVSYQVHLNHEEMEMELTRSEGDFERDMKYVEVPGIDAIWHQIWTDTVSDYPRLASSAAHVYGHPQAFTESFAAYRPAPDIAQARYIINEQMVRGVNLVETMYYPASQPEADTAPGGATRRGGPSALMRDPGWPALMNYTRRLSYVMSMGRPAASVALYIPSSSMWLNDQDADTAFVSTERMLSERQIDFDIINQNALGADLKAVPGALESMSGNRYRIVIIPAAEVLSQVELDRLRALARSGGKVLFLGATPSLISGRTILDARAATPADFDFATVETSAQLPPTPTPPAQPPAVPPAPQVVPPAIEAALARVLPKRDRGVRLDTPDAALMVITRRLKDADVYFFFNEGDQPSSNTVTLRAAGATVRVWDPATGSVSPVASHAGQRGRTFHLELKPYETRLITVQ